MDLRLPTAMIVLACLLAAGGAARAADQDVTAPPRVWHATLPAGLADARQHHRPLLVRIETDYCPWCKKLQKEFERAELAEELRRWTLVSLDATAQSDDAGRLSATGYPALRLLAPSGWLVASHDGYLPAAELGHWLADSYDEAAAPVDDALLAQGAPSAIDLVRLVRLFEHRDPTRREAASRRLLEHADVASAAVVRALERGNLSARLCALELLERWNAPVEGLDPWQPETFTPARLKAIEQWATAHAPAKSKSDDMTSAGQQLERLLSAKAADWPAIVEQLAHFGPALLPEVHRRLRVAETDDDRTRLTMLRYRLAASDALVLSWAGGLARLASADSEVRHQAADELVRRAAQRDEPLLVEMIGDADPLLRELAMRGLRAAARGDPGDMIIKLLDDPEPNVRAAVLQQLTESPASRLVPKLAQYLQHETDPDLLVHGIRALQATEQTLALDPLVKLLRHGQWQVRAEAAEAIGHLQSKHRNESVKTQKLADALLAVIELLDDSDAFVVNRALETVGKSGLDLPEAVDRIVRAATAHPEITKKAIEVLVAQNEMRRQAMPELRKFTHHADAEVRAAAISALVAATPDDLDKELAAALADSQSPVRIAAAQAIFAAMNEQRDRELPTATVASAGWDVGRTDESPPEGMLHVLVNSIFGHAAKRSSATAKPVDAKKTTGEKASPPEPSKKSADDELNASDQLLIRFRTGKKTEWLKPAIKPLLAMLEAASTEERISAALCLVGLGQQDRAVPLLEREAAKSASCCTQAAAALGWLPWPERLKMFEHLWPMHTDEAGETLLEALCTVPDKRAAAPLWKLAESAKSGRWTSGLYTALLQSYSGTQQSYNPLPAGLRERAIADASRHVNSSKRWTTLIAVELITHLDLEQGVEQAQAIDAAADTPQAVKADMLQIVLSWAPPNVALSAARTALRSAEVRERRLALIRLADLDDGLLALPDEAGSLVRHVYRTRSHPYGSQLPVDLSPPRGLHIEDLQASLAEPDEEMAALAHFLAVQLGEPGHLGPVLHFWRQHAGDPAWRKLAYEAISVANDSSQIPTLREIYAALNLYDKSDFYWTIRNMDGPEILKFRKEIRAEVGLENLH